MSVVQLRAELDYWRDRARQLAHRQAKAGAAKRARTIAALLKTRLAEKPS
jgi:hypothetical protein